MQGIEFDFTAGVITSVAYNGTEIAAKAADIFSVRLIDRAGKTTDISSRQAQLVNVEKVDEEKTVAIYSGFSENITVHFTLITQQSGIRVRIGVENHTDKIVEHIEPLPFIVKPFVYNGGIGRMLFPYNEGALVENDDLRAPSHLQHLEPDYDW